MWCVPVLDAEYIARMENVLNVLARPYDQAAPVVALDRLLSASRPPAVDAVVWRDVGPWRWAFPYAAAQMLGALCGVLIAHTMFELPLFMVSSHERAGTAQVFSEFVATFGLVVVVWVGAYRPHALAAVAAYITAACWFTASTSFANPAATLARACTDTVAGIRPSDVMPFVAAECAGAAAAVVTCQWLVPPAPMARSGTRESAGAGRPGVET